MGLNQKGMENVPTIQEKAIRRARRSVTCLPFRKAFYDQVSMKGITSSELVKRKDWQRLVFAPFGQARAEEHFLWMIRIGILRREVDGQGLTNRVRLTPLGQKTIEIWEGEIPRATLQERIKENFRRHRIG